MRNPYSFSIFRDSGLISKAGIEYVDIGEAKFWTFGARIDNLGSSNDLAVGASDVSRSGALRRGLGELVERAALSLTVDEEAIGGDEPLCYPRKTLVEGGLISPRFRAGDLIVGKNLSDGSVVHVPAELASYHPREAGPDASTNEVEMSPSGTASGLSRDSALVRALYELVERDAFMRAWVGYADYIVWSDSVLNEHIRASSNRSIFDGLRDKGCRFSVAIIPTAFGIVVSAAVVHWTSASGVNLSVVGLGASTSTGGAVSKAILEGCQLYLLVVRYTHTQLTDSATVSHGFEMIKLSELASGTYTLEIDRFLDAGQHGVPFLGDAYYSMRGRSEENVEELGYSDLLAALLAADMEVLSVELTERLPSELQDAGWEVHKCFVNGLQPLRINESASWNWSISALSRVSVAGAKGAGSLYGGLISSLVETRHPLP